MKLIVNEEFLKEVNHYKGDSIYHVSRGNVLAELVDEENSLSMSLQPCGEIRVNVIGKEDSYFDKEAVEYLRVLYEEKGKSYVEDEVYFGNNNWWEILFSVKDYTDGIVVDLNEVNSKEDIEKILLENRNALLCTA